jgi:transposase-like protein
MGQRVIRYSEAFKMQVIQDLESGVVPSVAAARKRYGIRGGATIQYWLRKYGRNHLINKVIEVKTPKDLDEVKELKQRVRELERALAQTQVRAVLNESFYEVVCEEHGITDPEAHKKKLESKLWKRR